ncbi:MAG: N-6 DNA methylase, partial [Chloroflexi bacterium]|nr:N-6 DNA methylase [Chloroflexota bacterium]
MRTVSRTTFTTVKTEGGILPADLLQRVADGQDLEGLRPEDYHLLPKERLNEAITRAWNRCLSAWANFRQQREQLPAGDLGTTLTRERWLLILFQELGYGRLPFVGSLSVNGAAYPISHRWDHTPILLVSFRQDLDRRGELGGVLRRSPHSLLQEFLNRSADSLWGFVSNGLCLRLLRDNLSLTRAAYVEFDLEAMLEGQVYADFVLLWLLCHQSRVESERPEECWLERWSQAATEQGVRALDALRDGVQEAIVALGRGFLAHRANAALRDRLRAGELSTEDYYRQVLRLVYRLIFLFVAEERELLLLPGTPDQAQRRYLDYYSIRRLRLLAETRRGGPHADLYRSQRLLFGLLREGYPPLGLPALGSFLFSAQATPDLDAADLANSDLLDTVRALAFSVEGRVRRTVDYRNLGSEELGSVYESLLELHPRLNVDAATFELTVAAGSERKTTGSYYTPTSLILSLLDSALEPVVEDRLRQAGLDAAAREAALLDIKVVDPACGSGHFLIAAAHRLARHLARVRTGEEEPAPAQLRRALRQVVSRCIHGVDINPMAVELCKVALWMETLDPGKPLGFLDRNIQYGNSLIGVTPGLDISNVPDDAFQPVTGDHRGTATALRRRNRNEQRGEMHFLRELFGVEVDSEAGELESALAEVEAIPEEDLQDVTLKALYYEDYLQSEAYRRKRDDYDLWTSAFFWPIPEDDAELLLAPTQAELEKRRQYWTENDALTRRARQIADENRFFHWELAFPTVFGREPSGFDVVLGNPPWEHTELKEKEWFATRRPDIAEARTGAVRKRMIESLADEDPRLYQQFVGAKRAHDGISHFVRNSGGYRLCGRGRINTYAVFAELARHLQSPTGRVGIIVPSGIATDDTTKFYFQDLMDRRTLVSLYDFENRKKLFPAVDSRMKFCLLSLTGGDRPATRGAEFVFFAQEVANLKDEERRFTLTADEIALLNPNTRTCPIFRSQRDAELTKAIYRRVPVL